MRGKPVFPFSQRKAYGIIPAHAGKTIMQLVDEGKERDHPRPCGENLKISQADFAEMGSSPPMRGKR